MQKLKSGDKVIVITGRDKGKQGAILRVLNSKCAKKGSKVIIEGINLVKRHTKANPSKEKPGGIIEKEAPLHISNIAIFNTTTNKADKVGFKILQDGRKVRFFKSNDEVIDV